MGKQYSYVDTEVLSPPFLFSIILTLFLSFCFVFVVFQFHYPLHVPHFFYPYFITVVIFYFEVKRSKMDSNLWKAAIRFQLRLRWLQTHPQAEQQP